MINLFVSTGAMVRSVDADEPLVTIGRMSSNVIVIPEPRVSRRHALIRRNERGYELVDMGSGNGTRLNGERVDLRPLTPGDEIHIGTTSLTVVALTVDDSSRTAGASAHLIAPVAPASRLDESTSVSLDTVTNPAGSRRIRSRLKYRPDLLVGRISGPVLTTLIFALFIAFVRIALQALSRPHAPQASGRELRPPLAPLSPKTIVSSDESTAALLNLRDKIARADHPTEALLAEAEALAAKHRQAPVAGRAGPFDDIVRELRHRQSCEEVQGLFDKVTDRAESALREGRYKDALHAAKRLNPDPSLTIAPVLNRVKECIHQDFEAVEVVGRRFEAQGSFAYAVEYYRSHARRFEGTEYHEALLERCEAARRGTLRLRIPESQDPPARAP